MFRIDGKNVFVCDESEFSGVKKIADKVCLDVERITGKKPEVFSIRPSDYSSRSQDDLTKFAEENLHQRAACRLNFQKSPANVSVTSSLCTQIKS